LEIWKIFIENCKIGDLIKPVFDMVYYYDLDYKWAENIIERQKNV